MTSEAVALIDSILEGVGRLRAIAATDDADLGAVLADLRDLDGSVWGIVDAAGE